MSIGSLFLFSLTLLCAFLLSATIYHEYGSYSANGFSLNQISDGITYVLPRHLQELKRVEVFLACVISVSNQVYTILVYEIFEALFVNPTTTSILVIPASCNCLIKRSIKTSPWTFALAFGYTVLIGTTTHAKSTANITAFCGSPH